MWERTSGGRWSRSHVFVYMVQDMSACTNVLLTREGRDGLIWFIWVASFNQTNKINKLGLALDAPRSASVRRIFAN